MQGHTLEELMALAQQQVAGGSAAPSGPSTMDSAQALGRRAIAGVAGTAGSTVRGIGSLVGNESMGQGWAQVEQEQRAAADALNPNLGFAGKVAEAVGSAVPFALGSGAAGIGARLLGAGARGIAAATGAASGAIGSLSQAQSDYEQALQSGASEEDAQVAKLFGYAFGATEAIPMWGFTKRLVAATGMSLTKAAGIVMQSALENAAQEAVQQGGSNLGAKVTYDPNRSLTEGAGEAAGIGAIVGAAGAGGGVAASRLIGSAQDASGEDRAPEAVQEPANQPGAAQEPVARKPLVASPETQAHIAQFTEAQKRPARAVEPTTPEDQFLTEFAQHRGTRVTLVEAEDGKPLALPASYREGEVLLDVNAPSAIRRRSVLYHELLHGLKDRQGETWETLYADIGRIDTQGLQQATEAYAKAYETTTGKPLSDALKGEEGLSAHAEALGAWLDHAIQNPQAFARVLEKGDMTFRERLRDTLQRFLEAFGVKIDSVLQTRLKELARDLGKPPTGDLQQSAELAQKFAYAINSLVGLDLKQPSQQTTKQGTSVAEEPKTDVGRTPPAEVPAPPTPTKADLGTVPEQKGPSPFFQRALETVNEIQARVDEMREAGRWPLRRPEAKELLDPKLQLKLTDMLASNLQWEAARAKEILGRELGFDDKQVANYLDLLRRARNEHSIEQADAAKQVEGVKERLRPRARKQIESIPPFAAQGPITSETHPVRRADAATKGYATEDILRALRIKHWEARANPVQKGKPHKGEASRKGWPSTREAEREKLGTDPRFAVAPKTDTPEFKRWFGESKVVDEGGKPRVVYHGTRGSRQGFTVFARKHHGTQTDDGYLGVGFYFDGNPDGASIYAGENGSVVAAYLSLQSPLELWQRNDPRAAHRAQDSSLHIRHWLGLAADATSQQVRDAAESRGYDGVIFHFANASTVRSGRLEYGSDAEYVAFRPEQIKSATGNIGTFDPKNPDIRFAVAPQDTQLPPAETRTDAFIRIFQQRLRRAQVLGKAKGVDPAWIHSEEAMPSKAKHKIEQIDESISGGVRKALDEYDIALEDAGEYVYALHAPDANRLAMERNPKKFGLEADPGSGMSNSEAAKIVAKYEADEKRGPGFKQISALLQRLEQEKRAGMVEAGRLSEEGSQYWAEKLGPKYITLKNAPVTIDGGADGRKGIGLGARREGRRSKAEARAIIPHTLALAADSAIKNEENKVRREIGAWLRELNDPAIAEIASVERLDAEGEVQQVSPQQAPPLKEGESLFKWREKVVDKEGKETGDVQDVYAIIRDQKLARAIDKSGIVRGGEIMEALRKVTHIYKMLRTVWNPEFFLTNPQSDIADAALSIQREGKGFGRKIIKKLPQAFAATWNDAHKTGRKTALSQHLKEFHEDGVPTGFYDYKTVEARAQELEAKFDDSSLKSKLRLVRDWVDATNAALENMTRFATYSALRDLGWTRDRAARAAREVTTPFMRRGEASAPLGVAYVFYNARVQSAVIAAKTIRSSRGKKALGALAGLSFTLTVLNRALMGEGDDGEDNWDKRNQFEKYQNILIGLPNSEKTLKLRAPRMFIPFWMLGVGPAEVLMGDLKPSQFAKDLFVAAVEGFSPVEVSGGPAQALLPTVAQPIVQPAFNVGPFGQRLNPDIPGDKRPPSEQFFPNVSPAAREIAEAINELTGGDKVTPGLVSLRPGSVENFLKFVGGGTGTFIGRLGDIPGKATAGELATDDLPVVRRLISGASPRHAESLYRDAQREISDVIYRHDAYLKSGDREKAQAVVEENMPLWRLRLRAKAVEKRIDAMRDRAERLPEGSDLRRSIEQNIKDTMAAFNRLVRESK